MLNNGFFSTYLLFLIHIEIVGEINVWFPISIPCSGGNKLRRRSAIREFNSREVAQRKKTM